MLRMSPVCRIFTFESLLDRSEFYDDLLMLPLFSLKFFSKELMLCRVELSGEASTLTMCMVNVKQLPLPSPSDVA